MRFLITLKKKKKKLLKQLYEKYTFFLKINAFLCVKGHVSLFLNN
jgi:hypothetical protein